MGGNGHGRPSYGNIQEISCHHVKSGVKLFYSEEKHQGYNEFIEHVEQEVKAVLMVAEECQTMSFPCEYGQLPTVAIWVFILEKSVFPLTAG